MKKSAVGLLVLLLAGCSDSGNPKRLISEMLTTTDGNQEQHSMYSLALIGEPAVGPLIEALGREETPKNRLLLIETLAKIGQPAVAPLINATKDEGQLRRWGAIVSLHRLKQIGQNVSDAAPAIEQATGDPDARVRKAALSAAGEFLGEKCLPLLIAGLKDSDSKVRLAAAQGLALGGLDLSRSHGAGGPVYSIPPEAVDPLVAALDDEDQFVRSAAANALGRMGADAKAAIPRLVELLQQPESAVAVPQKNQIATVLWNMGPEAIEPVRPLTQSEDPYVRSLAERIIEILSRPQPESTER